MKLLTLFILLAASALASSFTIQTHNFAVGNGGGFQASVNGSSLFEVFCADYLNTVGVPDTFDANISTLANISLTRYGTTAQAAFLYQAIGAVSLGNAFNRYLLAGWLTTQYDLAGGSSNRNLGIQHAIWDVLNVEGGSSQSGDTSLWLSNAVAWEMGQTAAGLAAFAGNVRIYTSSDVGGFSIATANRYEVGKQEQLNVIPEPAVFGLVGFGLIALGVCRRRK